MTTATSEDGTLQRLLEDEIESFLQYLRTARYADETLQRKRPIAREFARWAQQHLISADNLNSNSAAAFVARLPQRAKTRVALERATVRLFLEHLYRRGRLQRPLSTEAESGLGTYLQRYEDYLRRDRGLAINSVHVYVPFIRNFLVAQTIQAGCLSQDAIDTLNIRSFLVAQTKGRSGEYTRLLATSLRSFLRFLFFAGETARDLSGSVPMVRKYRMSAPPSFLSPEQTESILAATDRSTSSGRRDYAVLLLLARLGLRAGEVWEAPDECPAGCPPTVRGAPPGARYATSRAGQDARPVLGIRRARGIGVHNVGTRPPVGDGTKRRPTRHMGAATQHGSQVCCLVQHD